MNSTRDEIQRMLDYLDSPDPYGSAKNFRRSIGINLKGVLEDCISLHKTVEAMRELIGGVK